MVSFMILIFGIIDFIAGIILTFTATILPEVSRFIGLVLIGKGVWTIITSLIG